MTTWLEVYVAVLPLSWPRVDAWIGKVIVASDVAFLCIIVAVVATGARRIRPLRGQAVVFLGLPVLGIGLAALASRDPAAAVPDLLRTSYSACVCLTLAHLQLSEAETAAVGRTWIFVAVALSAAGLISFIGVMVLGWPPNLFARPNSPNLGRGIVRISPGLETNAFVLYLQASIAIGLFLVARGGAPEERRLLRAAVVFLLFVSVFTFSRGLIGLALSSTLLARRADGVFPTLWRARNGIATATVALAITGVFTTAWAVFPLQPRSAHDPNGPYVTINLRRNAYNVLHVAALRMFVAHPLLGVGPGRFGRELPSYATPGERLSAWPPVAESIEYDPHSTWFGWAAEGGLAALGTWAVLYGWLLWQLLGRGGQRFGLARVAGYALAGVLVNGFHVQISHLKFLWALFGLGLGGSDDRLVQRHEP